jgi:hypothetical protein
MCREAQEPSARQYASTGFRVGPSLAACNGGDVHNAVALVPAFSPTEGNTMRQMTGFNELRESSMWWDRR